MYAPTLCDILRFQSILLMFPHVSLRTILFHFKIKKQRPRGVRRAPNHVLTFKAGSQDSVDGWASSRGRAARFHVQGRDSSQQRIGGRAVFSAWRRDSLAFLVCLCAHSLNSHSSDFLSHFLELKYIMSFKSC